MVTESHKAMVKYIQRVMVTHSHQVIVIQIEPLDYIYGNLKSTSTKKLVNYKIDPRFIACLVSCDCELLLIVILYTCTQTTIITQIMHDTITLWDHAVSAVCPALLSWQS
jgi:hypothetical protein